ncbi:MAG: acyclic terpene utilization AtuA family protein [Candidatus Riflebacteria bacterium]
MTSHEEFRVLSPTAILGYGFPESSFKKGMERKPHLIAVDAGSTDPGPYYLGAGKAFTDRAFVKRDLRYMIKAGVAENIPVVVGTAGGSGASIHLEWCRQIILEISREEKLSFKMGVIPSDVEKSTVKKALAQGRIMPLDCVHELTEELVEQTTYLVAQIGTEPIVEALKDGCQVVLAGRCYDPAVFAALPIMKGYDPGLALHMGKILECAAIAATPGSGADCALGILKKDSFILEALSPKRKFTCESAAAHTLYEKSDPYHLPGPGGLIDLEKCSFTDIGEGRVEVKGSRFVPSDKYRIKLEGSRPIGYRSISIAGTRDPIMIAGIDRILSEVQQQLKEMSPDNDQTQRLFFHVYGKNGVMGPLEPQAQVTSHELCIVIEALCATQEQADTMCSVARSTLLHYGYEGRISTAGNLAFPFSPSDIRMGQVFEFSIYHLMEPSGEQVFKTIIQNVANGEVK